MAFDLEHSIMSLRCCAADTFEDLLNEKLKFEHQSGFISLFGTDLRVVAVAGLQIF